MNLKMLEKIAQAQTVTRADRFKDGRYELVVRKVLYDSKLNGTFFIGEFEVLKAEVKDAKITPNQVGTTVGFALNLDRNLSAPGNAKAFVLGLLGFEGEPNTQDLIATLGEITSDAQPTRGMIVACETYRTPIKSRPGEEYLGLNWRHLIQSAEEIASRRAKLDAGK